MTRTALSFAMKVLALALSYFITVLLARSLGAEGFGTYAYAMAWLNVLAGLSVLGFDSLLIKQLALYKSCASFGPLRGIILWSGRTALLLTALVLAVAFTVLYVEGPAQHLTRVTLSLTLLCLPLMVLIRLRQAALQGLDQVLAAQVPENLIQPGLYLAMIALLIYLSKGSLEAPRFVLLFMVSNALSFVVGAYLLFRAVPTEARRTQALMQQRQWLALAFPLFAVGALSAVNNQGEALVLGMLKGEGSVGRYVVANRLALLLSFTLVAANSVLPSSMVRFYEEGDLARLERLLVKSSRGLLLATLPMAILYVFAGRWVLGLFGAEFQEGYATLMILTAGQMVNVAAGSVGLLLMMTGHGRHAALGLGLGAAVNLSLAFLLVPRWGLEGAAVASALSVAVWNLYLVYVVKSTLGINTTVFGPMSWRRG